MEKSWEFTTNDFDTEKILINLGQDWMRQGMKQHNKAAIFIYSEENVHTGSKKEENELDYTGYYRFEQYLFEISTNYLSTMLSTRSSFQFR